MSTGPSLSIVIPVYNGAETVGELVKELVDIDIDGGLEIVLVDDCSVDDSREVCERMVKTATVVPIALVKLSRNYGEHNAVMAGLAYARGNYVITMDDDLQNPPSEVKRLYEYARDTGKEVVYTYYEQKKHSAFRKLGSWLANRTADILLDKPRGLYFSSFRCISSFVAREIQRYDGPFPYVDGMIMQVTQSVGQLKVEHLARKAGESGYTFRRLVRLWLSIFLNFSIMPLRLSTLLGILLVAMGALVMVVVLYEYLTADLPVGWASLMGVIFLFSGAQLIILGIAGEYIGRLYLTANRQPQYVVAGVDRGGTAGEDEDEDER